jgi:predicted nucleic acid-binding protein
MTTFVDTSSILAMLDAREDLHATAAVAWTDLIDRKEQLITTNYVVVETVSLATRRLGVPAVREFDQAIIPLVEVIWISPEVHYRAMAALVASSGRRSLSLVDLVSFDVMRSRGIDMAYALDDDFNEQGFTTIP